LKEWQHLGDQIDAAFIFALADFVSAHQLQRIKIAPPLRVIIQAIQVELHRRSAILDTSKFVRIAVDWLLRSDIGEVIKTIVDDETFPDYQISKKITGRKKRGRSR
jgi:hypothetical protein